jgi:SAM-dependent methyltransferase
MYLFASSIFLSAFLLFLVQPLIAKVILPWFGGSAAVWATCLMFFQLTLLAGYAYAHAVIRFLRPKTQATLHLTLLGLSVLLLPILPGSGWKPMDGLHPGARIVALLAATVGVPYLLLSTTGPLLQAWYARKYPGASPYRLYALSNAGSLIALISYPALIERLLRLRVQAYTWSAAYLVFVALCATVAVVTHRSASLAPNLEFDRTSAEGEQPDWKRRILWIGLAFCPSTLLVAVTTHLTQNISPVPLLWVLPLALYLLSFILTFESDRWYGRAVWFPLFVFAVAFLLAFLFPQNRNVPLKFVIPVFTLSFFVCAMVCHGELYRLRPAPRQLTEFYLMVSVGGALGGVFVGLLSPMLFRYYMELPIGLLAAVVLVGLVLRRSKPALPGPLGRYIEYALLASLAVGLVYLMAWQNPRFLAEYKRAQRNFYGTIRVSDDAETETTESMRELLNGTISHGSEFLRADLHRRPTTYYGPASAVGIALADRPGTSGRRVGVVGLGAGTISAYGRPGDLFRFYEINPMVVDIAKSDFFYLKECPAKWDVVLGDARLSLEREDPEQFDVLAVDAFTGDSIPVHLLTVEAFREYFRHLKPDGILAIHVSNRFLNLDGVVARAAGVLKKNAVLIDGPEDTFMGIFSSDWMVITGDPRVLERPEWNVPQREKAPPGTELWTDDYSNLVTILK